MKAQIRICNSNQISRGGIKAKQQTHHVYAGQLRNTVQHVCNLICYTYVTGSVVAMYNNRIKKDSCEDSKKDIGMEYKLTFVCTGPLAYLSVND